MLLLAGIDVYEKEPLPEGHKLRFVQNALILPHLGYVTAENYSIFTLKWLKIWKLAKESLLD